MRRWDGLVDDYLQEYRQRGLADETVKNMMFVLDDWGTWLQRRRPRPALERITPELTRAYLASRSHFRAKTTVYGTLSAMRRIGDFLMRRGLWSSNPLRWMKGPKVSPYSRVPKRIDQEHMEALWRAAAARRGAYSPQLWVTVLALLYGGGLRRGELERLDLDHYDRADGTLRVDGRKTGRERCVPLPEMALRGLEAYLPVRHNRLEQKAALGEPALLVGPIGERLTRIQSASACTRSRTPRACRFTACISSGTPAPPTCSRPACTWPRCSGSSATRSSRPRCATSTSPGPSGIGRSPFIRSTTGCSRRPHERARSADRRLSRLPAARRSQGAAHDRRRALHVARCLRGVRPPSARVSLWQLTLEDFLHWLESRTTAGAARDARQVPEPSARVARLRLAQRPGRAQRARRIQPAARRCDPARRADARGGRATRAACPRAHPPHAAIGSSSCCCTAAGCAPASCARSMSPTSTANDTSSWCSRPRATAIRFRSPTRSTPSCSPTCSSTASVARCSGPGSPHAHRSGTCARSSHRRPPRRPRCPASPRARCGTASPPTSWIVASISPSSPR